MKHNYWEDNFDDVVEEIKEYLIVISKRTEERDYLDSLSEGKDERTIT